MAATKTAFADLGKTLRSLGQSIDKVGQGMEASGAAASYVEHLVPSTRIISAGGKTPVIAENSFVAPNASLIGDVNLGAGSSVWYGAVIKGDTGTITVGNNTSIQDRAEVDSACVIGSGVTIAPSAVLHKANVGDDCFIGSGSKLVDGAVVNANSIIAPGAVVGAGKVVASGEYWAGNPAAKMRDLSAEEIEGIKSIALENFELAFIHEDQASKSFEQIEEEKEIYKQELERDPSQAFHPNPDLKLERKGLIYNQNE